MKTHEYVNNFNLLILKKLDFENVSVRYFNDMHLNHEIKAPNSWWLVDIVIASDTERVRNRELLFTVIWDFQTTRYLGDD